MINSLSAMPSSVFYLGIVLGVLSVMSWAIILYKYYYFLKTSMQFKRFEQEFWSGIDLASFYAEKNENPNTGEAIFCAGYSSLQEDKKKGLHSSESIAQAKESMILEQKKWELGIYKQLTWLATIASVSPYVGLLGTVFGVMHTFQGLLNSENTQASLANVAPGISEALAMTALGLFVAIPATVAFNRLSVWFDHLTEQFQLFQEEFILVVKKQV